MSASKPRRVDFHADEFLIGTSDLTLDETGSYWKVCSLIYSRGGPIPDDDRWIARVLGVDVRTWRPIKARLVEKGKLIISVNGSLTNARCQAEIAKASRRIEIAKENGERGGRPRSTLKSEFGIVPNHIDSEAISGRSPPGSPGDLPIDQPKIGPEVSADRSPISQPVLFENNDLAKPEGFRDQKANQEPRTKNHSYTGDEIARRFETFWRIYPKRGDHSDPKKPARQKFEAAIKRGADPETIIRGARNFAAAVAQNGTEPKFVPQAQTWLNQERWNDHQEAPQPRGTGTGGFTYGHNT